jgi:hypothetical protein
MMAYVVQWVGIGGVVPPELIEQVCDADGRRGLQYFGDLAATMEVVEWADTPGTNLPNLNQ